MVLAAELVTRAERLRRRVAPLARAHATAYGRVLAAFCEVGDPEIRRERIEEALSEAADVPLAIAEAGAKVAARLAQEGNSNLRGDAAAAAEMCHAVVLSYVDGRGAAVRKEQ